MRTVEISDSLAEEAQALAARETTLRALIEAGLRHVLREHRDRTPFRLRDASFEGHGLQEPVDLGDGSWARIREAIYEDRGG